MDAETILTELRRYITKRKIPLDMQQSQYYVGEEPDLTQAEAAQLVAYNDLLAFLDTFDIGEHGGAG